MDGLRFLLIVALATIARGLEISPLIDLDSGESERSLNGSASKPFANLKKGPVRAPLVGTLRSNVGNEFLKTENSKRRRSYYAQDDAKLPTVINNIKIVVGNATKSGENSCKNDACDVSVSSRLDDAGNIVTDVRLTVVTKLEGPPVDVPVIDGVRGVDPPDFYLADYPQRPHVYSNIPQIHTYRLESPERWYQGRRAFRGPPGSWYFYRPGERVGGGVQGREWVPGKAIADDKIEPPLSKTQPSDA